LYVALKLPVVSRASRNAKARYGVDVTKPIGSWSTSWRIARKASGVRVRFHDLRHTVVTRLLLKKVPFTVVSAMMGWSAANAMLMIKKYAILVVTRTATEALLSVDDS